MNKNFPKIQMPGVLPGEVGGVLQLGLDWYIIWVIKSCQPDCEKLKIERKKTFPQSKLNTVIFNNLINKIQYTNHMSARSIIEQGNYHQYHKRVKLLLYLDYLNLNLKT